MRASSPRTSMVPLVLALSAIAARPGSAGPVSGVVLDADTGAPIPGAAVHVVDTEHRTETDEEGRFAFADVEPGEYTMQVDRLGYGAQSVSIEVPQSGGLRVRVHIDPSAIRLEPVSVEVRSAKLAQVGFFDRMDSGRGTFLTREDIEAGGSKRLSVVLARAVGMRRIIQKDGSYALVMRGQHSLKGDCRTAFVVDGVRIPLAGPGIDNVPPDVVEGVEVYRGMSQLPARFPVGDGACGAIVVWTRTGR